MPIGKIGQGRVGGNMVQRPTREGNVRMGSRRETDFADKVLPAGC